MVDKFGDRGPNRRDLLQRGAVLGVASVAAGMAGAPLPAKAQPEGGQFDSGRITSMVDQGTAAGTRASEGNPQANDAKQPNILYVQIDNLGWGELGCYGGGVLRGAPTTRIDKFASEGMQLLNFAPEAQCTPSRSALMTGRYAIRSGNGSVQLAGASGGIVAWERTMGDILSDAGYATACYGKWHIGTDEGRFPTDHGFDEWYGIPHTYDECLWPDDPFYQPGRDPESFVIEGRKGEGVRNLERLDMEVRRNIDREYLDRADAFIRKSVADDKPFYIYFNHSMLHLPTIPRAEFAGISGAGDFADCAMEMDADFGRLLDLLDELGLADNTIVVFAGDNGPEDALLWRGTAGYWEGSYFTGMEGALRTPCLIRWPGHVPAGRVSNEIVHMTDMFTTLLTWVGAEVPADREIDGVDQGPFFEGEQETSGRDGFLFWNGEKLYGVKWQNFKTVFYDQTYFFDTAAPFANPRIINLLRDPKEREPADYPHMHTWVIAHFSRLLQEFQESVVREPLIPPGAPLDYVPRAG
jgi:arylsulfatase A-like enzyme